MASIFIIAYFDLRLVSIFNIRLKLENNEKNSFTDNKTFNHKNYIDLNDNQEISTLNKASNSNNNSKSNIIMLVNFDNNFRNKSSTDYNSKSDNNSNNSIYNSSDNIKIIL